MATFANVLCPIDFSETSLRALEHAVVIAMRSRAHLTVAHVAPTFEPVGTREGTIGSPTVFLQPPTREEIAAALRDAAIAAGITPSHLTVAVEDGETVPTIIDQAVSRKADLLVLGTHGRSGFNRLLLGSVTERLLRRSPCPVLTVPPHAGVATSTAAGLGRRVLCPIDFSPASYQALGFALALARDAEGTVTALHVLEWLADREPRTTAHFNVEEYRRYLIQDASSDLARAVDDATPGSTRVAQIVVPGRAYREVLHRAADHDLIVMGAQGRGGVGLALFGSTTQHVVRVAPCPVLTVRSTGGLSV